MMTEIFAQGDLLLERVPDVPPSGTVAQNAEGAAMVLAGGEERIFFVEHPPVITLGRRAELAKSRPTFVLDGLSLFNSQLAIDRYPELRAWFAQYREAARSRQTIVYELRTR